MTRFLISILVSATMLMFNLNINASDDVTEDPAPSGTVLTEVQKAQLNDIDIPILNFNLAEGAFPDFECISHPEGCVGASIINNKWVEGELKITRKGEVLYESGPYVAKESGIRLKARGNGSSNEGGIKSKRPSYKIKLSKKANILIGDESVSKSKDWVLLKDRYVDLKNIAGFETARLLGLGWQPRGYMVVLMINGNYFGNYFLIEAISADKDRIDITDSGFIIEDDAYWWKQPDESFKTEYIQYAMGWTFKDPDFEDLSEDTRKNIEKVTRLAENVICNGPDSESRTLGDVIDIESFATWVLAQDIINNRDGNGSNIFLIKDDLDMTNPFNSKFRMNALWDMDGAFNTTPDAFSSVHASNMFWYPKLFEYPEFCRAYKEKWDSVKYTIFYDVMKVLNERLKLMPGLDASRRWAGSMITTKDCMQAMEDYFQHRLPVLDNLIENIAMESGVNDVVIPVDIPSSIPSDGGVEWIMTNNARVFGLDGVLRSSFAKGVNIIRFSDGQTIKLVF